MANGTVEFFAPTCPFTFEGWTAQNAGGETTSQDYASELGMTGDEIAHGTSGGRTTASWTFIASAAGTLTPPKVGQVAEGWHLDDISIAMSRDALRYVMTANAHKHTAGNAHGSTENPEGRTYAPSVTLTQPEFGMSDDLGGVKLKTGAVVDFRDATYKLACSHVDEANRTGGELKGNNYDGVETLDVNFTGAFTADDVTVTDGWTETSSGATPSNTGVTTSSLSLVHHVAHEG